MKPAKLGDAGKKETLHLAVRGWRGAAVCLLALALGGCVATQSDVLDLENQTDNLRVQINDLKQTISSMQANQADLVMKMGDLHDTLAAFTDAINTYQVDMGRLSSKIDDLDAQITNRVASIGSALTQAQAKESAETRATLAKQAKEALSSPTELFNTSDIRLSLKDYALAAQGFKEYIQKFPNGALIDVATYKLGRAYYGEGKWEEGGRQFALFLEKYPKSSLTPAARLMYALCLIKMGQHLSEARQYLESIPADFPGSPESRAAAVELRKLKSREHGRRGLRKTKKR